jgi:hypothetical protein
MIARYPRASALVATVAMFAVMALPDLGKGVVLTICAIVFFPLICAVNPRDEQ